MTAPGDAPFDFREPAPLNEARLQAITSAHLGLVERLAALWREWLPDDAIVELGAIGRANVATLCAGDAPAFLGAVIPTERREAPVVVVVPADLIHVMVDRILGGPGELIADGRRITSIESKLIAAMVDATCEHLARLYELDAHPPFATCDDLAPLELEASGATALTVTVGVAIGAQTLPVTVIVPAGAMSTIVDVLAGGIEQEDEDAGDAESHRRAVARLVGVPVEVRVRFSPSAMPSSDILNLKVGDMVDLGTPSGGLLDLLVDDLRMALVRPARNGDGLACQVVAKLDEPELVTWTPIERTPTNRTNPGAS